MKIKGAALFTLSCLLWSPLALAEKHHHMKEAHHKMKEAEKLMIEAPHEYDGHRAKALELLKQAMEENKKGVEWAEQNHIEH